MAKTHIPKDPVILISYINMQLRDHFSDLDELCASLGLDKQEIIDRLDLVDYQYDEKINQFRIMEYW